MKNLRTQWNRFLFKNRDKGIPNLMLYLSLGSAVAYLMSMVPGGSILYDWLSFHPYLIMQGDVWRLFTYPLTYGMGNSNLLLVAISLFCYYSLGRAIENVWGTLKFNLFYLTGVLLTDIFCLVFNIRADVYSLNLSLFLTYATLFPQAQFLLMFIIPVKAWLFALVDLILTVLQVYSLASAGWPFPHFLYPLIAIGNYFLFMGKGVANVFPQSWRINTRRLFKKKGPAPQKPKVVPFPNAGPYETAPVKPQATYTHKCTICGRTDVDSPDLEFRYCSRCNGYHCYCIEHINNHTHVE